MVICSVFWREGAVVQCCAVLCWLGRSGCHSWVGVSPLVGCLSVWCLNLRSWDAGALWRSSAVSFRRILNVDSKIMTENVKCGFFFLLVSSCRFSWKIYELTHRRRKQDAMALIVDYKQVMSYPTCERLLRMKENWQMVHQYNMKKMKILCCGFLVKLFLLWDFWFLTILLRADSRLTLCGTSDFGCRPFSTYTTFRFSILLARNFSGVWFWWSCFYNLASVWYNLTLLYLWATDQCAESFWVLNKYFKLRSSKVWFLSWAFGKLFWNADP